MLLFGELDFPLSWKVNRLVDGQMQPLVHVWAYLKVKAVLEGCGNAVL